MTAEFIQINHPDGSVEYRHPDIEELERKSIEQTAKEVPRQFTPEQMAEMTRCQEQMQAREYLASTDWYASRRAETGQAIPADVLEQRQSARQLLSS